MTDTSTIITLLSSDNPEDIREGAWSAGEGAVEEAIPLLAKHLNSANLGVQEAADQALRRIGGSGTVSAVIPLLRSDDAPARNLSMDILREVGDQDFDALLSLLHDEDVDIRIFASDILGSTQNVAAVKPLCEAMLKDPEVNVRYQAAVSLGNLAFKEAAPCLNKALEDEEWVQFSVIEALTKIRDASSVDALARALGSSSDLVASMIIEALGEMGNIKAVPVLLRRMDDSPTALRNKIVQAIVRILGGKSLTLLSPTEREKFRDYLLVALQDEDDAVQDTAMLGLSHVGGEAAARAVLSLAEGLNPDSEHERLDRAVDCLAAIGFNEALAEAVRTGETYPAQIALEAMMRMADPGASPAVLTGAFWDKDRDMQRELAKALYTVGTEAEAPFFLDVLERHEDGGVLKTAMLFLGEKLSHAPATEPIFAMLEHEFDDVKEAALEALVAIDGPVVNDRFRGLSSDEEPINRMMAVYALGRISGEDNHDILIAALGDPVPDIRKVALEALGVAVCVSDEDLEKITNLLSDEESEVRLAVVELFKKCADLKVIEHLYAALEDPDDWVRVRAVEALAELRQESSVPKLVPLLEAGHTLVVLKVVDALSVIGGQAAFRSLLELLNHEDPEVVGAAEAAIGKQQAEGAN